MTTLNRYNKGLGDARVSQFHGVSVYMYFYDHAPPHFHAMYGDDEAVITIVPPSILFGNLPRNFLKRVLSWTGLHQAEQLVDWQLAQRGQPLNPIPPPP